MLKKLLPLPWLLCLSLSSSAPLLAQYSSGQVPIEPPSVPYSRGDEDSPLPGFSKTGRDVGGDIEELIDADSVSTALQIAAKYGDPSDGRLVLKLRLSRQASPVEERLIAAAAGKKSIDEVRSEEFSKVFGPRANYDPNYPTSTEETVSMLSLPVKSDEMRGVLRSVAMTYPQITRISAEYQQYEQSDFRDLPKVPVVVTIDAEVVRALRGSGVYVLTMRSGGKAQVLITTIEQLQQLAHLDSESSPNAADTKSSSRLKTPSLGGSTANGSYYIWLDGRPADVTVREVEALGGLVVGKTSRRLTLAVPKRDVERLRKAGYELHQVKATKNANDKL